MIVRRPRNATGDQLFGGDKSSDISMGFLNRQQWKFMGWMDVAKLKISCVEQSKAFIFTLLRVTFKGMKIDRRSPT